MIDQVHSAQKQCKHKAGDRLTCPEYACHNKKDMKLKQKMHTRTCVARCSHIMDTVLASSNISR